MSDLLIRGMEMPKGNDAVTIIIFPNGKVSLAHDRRFAEYAEAVPVPPHGRLIDADVLIARYEKQRAEDRDILCDERAFPSDYERAQYRYSRNSDFISALNSQAAIIPAEEGET